jgi:phage shock protein C
LQGCPSGGIIRPELFASGGMMEKRIYRSRDERVIWGVCSGLAKYFDVDPTIIRIIAVLTLFFACTGILIYIILTIIIPLEPRKVSG